MYVFKEQVRPYFLNIVLDDWEFLRSVTGSENLDHKRDFGVIKATWQRGQYAHQLLGLSMHLAIRLEWRQTEQNSHPVIESDDFLELFSIARYVFPMGEADVTLQAFGFESFTSERDFYQTMACASRYA